MLAAAGELQDALLEDFEELGEGLAEGGGEADDGVEGAVDDEPVIFGGFFEIVVFGLEVEVGLAGVGALEEVQESFGQGFEDGGRGDQGRAGDFEGGGEGAAGFCDGIAM